MPTNARYIINGFSNPLRGTVRIKHLPVVANGLAPLCGAFLSEPHKLTGRIDAQYALCRNCARVDAAMRRERAAMAESMPAAVQCEPEGTVAPADDAPISESAAATARPDQPPEITHAQAVQVTNALAVIVFDARIRDYLAMNDPMALRQAIAALAPLVPDHSLAPAKRALDASITASLAQRS